MQRSFDDLGAPLVDVTFVVIDLETTGGSPATCGITEVGAVRIRGGVQLGAFHTLVNPGLAIPPQITYLTGITESMVGPAPVIEAVLPALVEFIGGAVIVGHNVRFDVGFLDAALLRHGYGRLANQIVDTCGLARRLVREEVRDCKLATLAAHFRLPNRPSHRALEDALATADLLHALLERAGTLGVVGLEDLVQLPTVQGHPMVAKLRLARDLPRAPGVYLFHDAGGRVLYVGKAVDLRRRVRSYFSSDDRRKVGPLLRELAAIGHVRCTGELEASVLEVRLIHALTPRYNRQATQWRRYVYVKLTAGERWPRLSVVRATPPDGGIYLGPVASAATAKLVAEGIESVVPLRRCAGRVRTGGRDAPCTPAQLGVATCPCAGTVDEAAYRGHVERVVAALTGTPEVLLEPLAARITRLAVARRYEEAAATRDRLAALSRVLTRQRRWEALRRAGRLVVTVPGSGAAELHHGRLVRAWADGGEPGGGAHRGAGAGGLAVTALGPVGSAPPPAGDGHGGTDPVRREDADELACVTRWLDQRADRIRILDCDGGWSWPAPDLPRYEPGTMTLPELRRPVPVAEVA